MNDAPAVIVLLARIVLAVLFLAAGIAKLSDRSGGRRSMIEFGAPEPMAAPLAILLPLFEVLVGASLLVAPVAWYGAWGALALLILFLFAIAITLTRGRRPDCHCFGQIHSAPVGWTTVARNALFAFIAGFVVFQGSQRADVSAVAVFSAFSFGADLAAFGGVFMFGLSILQALLLFLLLRQQGRFLLRLEALEVHGAGENGLPDDKVTIKNETRGLAVGTHAPSFRLSTLTGELVSLEAVFGSRELAILIFTNPKCGPCLSLMPDVRRWEQQSKSIRLVLISEGTLDDNSQKFARFGASLVLLQQKREVAEAYLANGTPAAVVIRNGGTIASPLAFGADAVRSLFERLSIKVEAVFQNGNGVEGGINNRSEVLPGSGGTLKVGDQAPSLEFLDTNARHVSFSSFRGKKTLLIFWNPGCHFCQEMLIRLRALETEMVPDNGNLALISSGKAPAHQEMGLRSTILLDENLTASTAFGSRGTPTAVLLSAEGIITSDVLIGSQSILELARSEFIVPGNTVLATEPLP